MFDTHFYVNNKTKSLINRNRTSDLEIYSLPLCHLSYNERNRLVLWGVIDKYTYLANLNITGCV